MTFESSSISKSGTEGESAAPTLTFDHAGISKFIDAQKDDSSFSQTDLDKIIQDSSQAGDNQSSSIATFLKDNYNDFRSISAKGGDEIGSDDLTLYSEMLKQSEQNVAEGKAPEEGLYAIHNSHENQAGFVLPAIGTLGGIYGADKVLGLVARNPLSVLASLKGGVPGMVGLGVAHVAGWAGGAMIGANIGGMIDRGLQSNSVQSHFVDEAAPAMKRLFEKQHPSI